MRAPSQNTRCCIVGDKLIILPPVTRLWLVFFLQNWFSFGKVGLFSRIRAFNNCKVLKTLIPACYLFICLIICLGLSNADSSLDCDWFWSDWWIRADEKESCRGLILGILPTLFGWTVERQEQPISIASPAWDSNPASTAYECYHWIATFGSSSF